MLAILGGKPTREESIPYGKQYIDEDDIRAVNEVLRSPYLTTGPKVEEFENKLCELTGQICCSNLKWNGCFTCCLLCGGDHCRG